MTAGIRFCGGCNPRIDRERFVRDLKEALADLGISIAFPPHEAGFVIYLSGCLSGCAFQPSPTGPPFVVVAGTAVGGQELGEHQLVGETTTRVRKHYERLEAELRNEDLQRGGGPHAG